MRAGPRRLLIVFFFSAMLPVGVLAKDAPRVLPQKLQDLLYPRSASALRSQLVNEWGFPSWWPVPEAVNSDRRRPPSVLTITSEEELVPVGKSNERVTNFRTDYFVPNGDLDAAVAWVTQRVPTDHFELAAPRRQSGTLDGNDFVSLAYRSKDRAMNPDRAALTVDVAQTGGQNGVADGVTLRFGWSPNRGADATLPSSAALAGLARVATPPGAVWRAFRTSGGVNAFAPNTVVGEYSRSWLVASDKVPAAKAFFSDPANYHDAVSLRGAARKSGQLWSQPLFFVGIAGDVAILDPTEPAKPSYIRMSFRVSG